MGVMEGSPGGIWGGGSLEGLWGESQCGPGGVWGGPNVGLGSMGGLQAVLWAPIWVWGGYRGLCGSQCGCGVCGGLWGGSTGPQRGCGVCVSPNVGVGSVGVCEGAIGDPKLSVGSGGALGGYRGSQRGCGVGGALTGPLEGEDVPLAFVGALWGAGLRAAARAAPQFALRGRGVLR